MFNPMQRIMNGVDATAKQMSPPLVPPGSGPQINGGPRIPPVMKPRIPAPMPAVTPIVQPKPIISGPLPPQPAAPMPKRNIQVNGGPRY